MGKKVHSEIRSVDDRPDNFLSRFVASPTVILQAECIYDEVVSTVNTFRDEESESFEYSMDFCTSHKSLFHQGRRDVVIARQSTLVDGLLFEF